jgi:hypothetical protein
VFIDKAAVHGLYKQLMDGWNTGSGEAFAAFHQSLFDKRFKGTRLVGEVKSVRFLTPEVAMIHTVGGTVMRGKSEPSSERDSIQTLVATKDGKVWRLAAFQNTRIRPMGRSAGGTFLWLFSDWLWKRFGQGNECCV